MLLVFLTFLLFEHMNLNRATFKRNPIHIVQMLVVDELVHQPLQFLRRDFLRIYRQITAIRSNLLTEALAQKIGKRVLSTLQLATIHFQLLPPREQTAHSPLRLELTLQEGICFFSKRRMRSQMVKNGYNSSLHVFADAPGESCSKKREQMQGPEPFFRLIKRAHSAKILSNNGGSFSLSRRAVIYQMQVYMDSCFSRV